MSAPPIPDEQAALLRAIVAEPEEDTPRLVYADWLQEHGDEEQAAFIRDSLKLVRMKPQARGRESLHARLEALANKRGETWLHRIGIEYAQWERSEDFVRGFVENPVYWDLSAFLEEYQILFARQPVRTLWISHAGQRFSNKALQAIAAMPELARLLRLELFNDNAGDLPLGGWNALIRSPHLSGLREFYPTGFGLSDEHLFALAASPNMAALTSLDLSDNDFTTEGQLAILRSPHLAGVKKLSLDNGDYPDDDVLDLVVSRFGNNAPLLKSIHVQE